MKISKNDFIHPEDRAALEHLESMAMFPTLVKGFFKIYNERLIHGLSMAEKIRLGPNQLPEIYRLLPPLCETLGIAEPEFYLEMNPGPNAYTTGHNQTFVTVTSGLLEYLDEDELQAVVAHECGHIACGHVLYHTMTRFLIQFGLDTILPVDIVIKPAILGLLYWSRRSELSADRAAAVALKSPQPIVEVMVRLAGGPKSITGKVNLEEFMKQAEAYDSLLESSWDKLLQNFQAMGREHPSLSVRTREITRWCQGDHYQKILEALGEEESRQICPGCGKPGQEKWKFCCYCGYQNLNAKPEGGTC